MQTSVKLDILLLNVRGIRDQFKRRSIFSFLKDFKANIYFLQETYSDLKDENIWKNEWGGEIFFSHGTNHSKGVCILINPAIHCQVDYCYSNNSGRIVLITITLGSQKLTLCNIYAPTNQTNQLEFMQEYCQQYSLRIYIRYIVFFFHLCNPFLKSYKCNLQDNIFFF